MGCGYRKRKEIEKRQKMKERNTLKRERERELGRILEIRKLE